MSIDWNSVNDRKSIEKFPVVFKRFSYESKYKCGVLNSLRGIRWQLDTDENTVVYPWEVSFFAMMSLMGEDSNARWLTNKEAIKIFKFIRNNMFSHFEHDIRCMLPHSLMREEIKFQYNFRIVFERYLFFFGFKNEKIDMPKIIKEKFGVDYHVFLDVAMVSIFLGVENVPFEYFGWLIQEKHKSFFSADFIDVMKKLSIDRDSFIELQKKYISQSSVGIFQTRNALEDYPFIRMGKKYLLPAPHLAVYAVTYKILARITEGSDQSCADIGKQIQEKYLKRIFELASCYERVREEIQYNKLGKSSQSPDVIVEKDGHCLLIDSKFYRPTFRLRDLTVQTAKLEARKLSEGMVQLYKRISERSLYLKDGMSYSDDDVFGLLVVFQDSLLFREFAYDEVAEVYPTATNWIKKHIHVVGLDEVEKYCYRHLDVFPGLIRWMSDDASCNDFCLPNDEDSVNFNVPLHTPLYTEMEKDIEGLAQRIILRSQALESNVLEP